MLFEILFDIIGALLGPILSLIGIVAIPIAIIGLVGFFLRILLEYTSFKSHQKKNGYANRYRNPTRPDVYRPCDNMRRCSNCDQSVRSDKEGSNWYCQKHQIDVHGHYVCNNYHSTILDP